ncbi:hypothetical protein HB662_11720 [Roseomonas frigidaquae]|uniref:Carbohydrate binding module xylan-binding domain-containing protein n=1 Tax=Falsiroseomonas frigidaquae TaxID=487318 RepID=A0ABX1EZC4_9PROT|nr:carbohydrate-binding domain-containing protein [Falsiroseomonas frigidaquae]NKE45446.1 hypothetical protein [Falsiroseomonas frigidaquae]
MSDSTHGLVLQNAGGGPLAAGIATFGQVFQQGEVPAGASLVAQQGGTALPVQMDVKTRYEDGSVKMAVLAVQRPALAAGESVDLVLAAVSTASAPPALDLAQGLTGHSFTVDIAIQGGATLQVDVLAELRAALADGSASFWQQGALTSEARVEIDLPGSQRMVFDVAVFKGGGFAVEAQFNNDQAMQASGGRVQYDVTVTMDGKVAAQETLDQGQYQNWHQGFASNTHDGGQGIGSPAQGWLNIQHDIAWLQDAGAVARYDLDQSVNPSLLNGYANAIKAAGWDEPLDANGVTTYMPGTGGRPDIGFTTLPNTVWLLTQDARAAAYAMGQAEAASAVPWHFWDAENGTWLNTDAYPKLWLDARGGTGTPGDANSTGLTQQVDGQTGWHTDAAHQPDLSYVPYLMTGERWMLDNLQAQAVWSILSYWPDPRGDGNDNVIDGSQVRAAAWSLRQVDEAARVSPDGSAEQAFFQEASDANYAWLVSKIPEWTAMQGESHGWVPGDYGTPGAMPPWQQDYFASTVIAATRNGNADARTFLEWQTNFLVGRFMSEDQGFEARDGAAYLIATSDPQSGRIYTSWAEIGAQTEALGWSNGDSGWARSEGDYAQLALATLAGIYEITGSAEAKQAYELLIAEKAPFSTPADYTRDPTYAIAAPGKVTVELPPVELPPVELPPVELPSVELPGTPAPAPEPALVALAVVLGAESWSGDPMAVVKVDGVEVFRGSVSAQHSQGGARYELGEFAAGQPHVVQVAFLNDAWGGSAETDRNLHVEAVLVDGVETGHSRGLFNKGEVAFDLDAAATTAQTPPVATPPVVTPPVVTPPVVTPPPATPAPVAPQQDVLTIGISGDAWQGNAQYVLTLDGERIGGIRVADAVHAQGETEQVTITGDFTGGLHKLGITFINDAWGGHAAADRNLHVDFLSINGTDLDQSVSLTNNGSASFDFTADTAAASPSLTPVQTLGAGEDKLRLAVSQDAWQGDAQFILFLNGEQLGGTRTVQASHAEGAVEIYEILGTFGDGNDVLGVRFLNDAWGGNAAADRNLYVDHLSLNGTELHGVTPLLSSGDVFLQF